MTIELWLLGIVGTLLVTPLAATITAILRGTLQTRTAIEAERKNSETWKQAYEKANERADLWQTKHFQYLESNRKLNTHVIGSIGQDPDHDPGPTDPDDSVTPGDQS